MLTQKGSFYPFWMAKIATCIFFIKHNWRESWKTKRTGKMKTVDLYSICLKVNKQVEYVQWPLQSEDRSPFPCSFSLKWARANIYSIIWTSQCYFLLIFSWLPKSYVSDLSEASNTENWWLAELGQARNAGQHTRSPPSPINRRSLT